MERVTSADLQRFLENCVNLKRDDVEKYRAQVAFLRDRLAVYVQEHPDFELIKMLHFGSLAKGTAISTLNDIDLAVYLRPERLTDRRLSAVLGVLRELLMKVYPQMETSQFRIDPPAVTISFRSSGLEVDVVPVIPNGKPNDRGLLAIRDKAEWVETSIPLHLEFIRKRSERFPNFRPLIRMSRWWSQVNDLPLTPFELELLWAHLFGTASVPDDLQEGLLKFFSYIERTNIATPIVFTDNYTTSEAEVPNDPVRFMDPVNPTNNVAQAITAAMRDEFVHASEKALDSAAAASTAYAKHLGVEYYRKLFGSGFDA